MASLLVTVSKLFGILSTCLLGALAQTEVNTLHALCERIREDPKNVNLQALSPLGTQLHLIAWDILYTVSFTGEVIDSDRGRINLNCKDSGSKWTQVPWLKPAVEKIGQQDPALVYMNIFVNPDGNQKNLSQKHAINVIYRKDSRFLEQVWLNPGGRNINQKLILYGVVTTGALGPQAAGSKYQFQETPVPGIIVMGLTNGTLRLPILAQDKRTVVFHKKMHSKSQRTLVTRLPVFGFIHSNVVHLWDTENGHVVLFDNVPELGKQNSDESDKSVSVLFVPFQDYFHCDGSCISGVTQPSVPSQSSSPTGESNIGTGGPDSLDGTQGPSETDGSNAWLWILAILVLLSILGASGFWYYKRLQRKRKKANKGHKATPTKSTPTSKKSKLGGTTISLGPKSFSGIQNFSSSSLSSSLSSSQSLSMASKSTLPPLVLSISVKK